MRPYPRGFTLVELLLVVVLMSVVMGLAVANFSGVFGGMELRRSADDMAAAMRYGQARAAAEGLTVRLVFAEGFRQYRLQQAIRSDDGEEGVFENISSRFARPVMLPRDVAVDSDLREINFYSDGTIDRVRVHLKAKGRQRILSSMGQRGYVFVLDE